jgi:hypothetical protein
MAQETLTAPLPVAPAEQVLEQPPVVEPLQIGQEPGIGETSDLPGITVPGEFNDIATTLHEETVITKRSELKAQAAEALSPALESLTESEVQAYLEQVNNSYGGVFSGEDLCLLSARRENAVIVNTQGRLEEVPITQENVSDVLSAVKAADAEGKRGHSYGLRHEILKRSEGRILTHDAYTYAEQLPSGEALDAYLDDPESWVPERRALQQDIVDTELQKASQLSERLDDEQPTVYVLRGNTAAGKTTAVRSNENFAKALDTEGEPSGSINPDTYKETLKENEAEGTHQTVSHFQAHEEGSMIARKINESIAKSDSSMVIDKRMSKMKNFAGLLEHAETNERLVKILDVDVPLELSLVRVLERPIGGESPNVPFDAVAEGFSEIRDSRATLLRKASSDEKIADYVLRVADDSGISAEVARKVNGEIEIDPQHEDLFMQATDQESVATTINTLSETVITDDYVEAYIARVHADDPEGARAQTTRAALVRYRGKTLKQALDERASTLNEN